MWVTSPDYFLWKESVSDGFYIRFICVVIVVVVIVIVIIVVIIFVRLALRSAVSADEI